MPELRLNLGCGGNILEGFENHDLDVDITKPLTWKDGEVDYILAEHVFEHVTSPDALRFLDECYRILKPRGTIRLCIPILERLTNAQCRDMILNHGHLAAYQNFDALKRFLKVAGFREVITTPRKDCDGHYRVIGEEKDDLETCRIEAVKP